ncbi:MAG: hypothetical protein JWR15_2873 [Prosthecobacter sp.]|nr:hypothetical protein [Prosthecobacter sp.]
MSPGSKINLTKIFQPSPLPTGPDPVPKNNEDRMIGTLAHVLPIVGPLVPPHYWIFAILPPLILWQLKRGQNLFLSAVGQEVLNFQICAAGILTVASILSFIPLLGFVFALAMPLAVIAVLVLMLMAALESWAGKFVRYKWIQRFVK